jgi:hypothetical protein
MAGHCLKCSVLQYRQSCVPCRKFPVNFAVVCHVAATAAGWIRTETHNISNLYLANFTMPKEESCACLSVFRLSFSLWFSFRYYCASCRRQRGVRAKFCHPLRILLYLYVTTIWPANRDTTRPWQVASVVRGGNTKRRRPRGWRYKALRRPHTEGFDISS